MNVSVDIDVAADGDDPPEPDSIRRWLRVVLDRELPADDEREVEVSVRVVGCEEMQALNRTYRQNDKPTNVLAFPSNLPPDLPFRHLGDIVACAPVIRNEAREQNKTLDAHWAHMLVHGALHLLGYDHIEVREADVMEAREIDILAGLGIANPYISTEDTTTTDTLRSH